MLLAFVAMTLGILMASLMFLSHSEKDFVGTFISNEEGSFSSVALPGTLMFWFIPAFFGRLWLLAYVGSGLLLKTARRLDLGYAWFNKKFDVENHPLQCIGLVAGTLCALGYWLLALIHLVP